MEPPIVPGLTQLPEPSPGPGLAQLALLMGQRGGGSRVAATDLKDGLAALRRAAEADPRLAERIRLALDAIEGTDTGRSTGDRTARPKTAPTVGADLRTPI